MKMDPQVWHKVAAISGTSSNESLLLLSLFPFSSVTQNEKFTETGMAALGLGTYGAHGFKPQNPSYKDVCSSVSLFPQWLFTSNTSLIFFNLFICHFFFQLEICNLSVKVWHTASLYHLVHTAALVAAPITKNPNVVSSHFSISLLDFSFSYIFSVCNVTI